MNWRKFIPGFVLIALLASPASAAALELDYYTYNGFAVFDDLYRNTNYLFRKISNISSMPGVDGAAAGNRCSVKVYEKALSEFGRLHESVRAVRADVSRSYVRTVQENLAHWNFAKIHEREERELRAKHSLDVTR